ncbi:unnamed protein product [Alopecurus aequalis]
MDSGGPVMTESERRAYRYAQAPRVQGLGVRKSWSNDSLFSLVGSGSRVHSCVCAPTTHPGSFRCKHHRQIASHAGAAAYTHVQSTAEADSDMKRNEVHEERSSAEQENAS